MNRVPLQTLARAFGAVIIAAGLMCLPLLLPAPRAGAQTPQAGGPLIARGRQIAEGRCARCHSIDKTGESPQRDVVPFRELPARYPVQMLMEVSSTGIISGHEEMPMTALGREDVDALLAFIDSFSPPGGPRYLKK